MDEILAKAGSQAVTIIIKSGISIASTYALKTINELCPGSGEGKHEFANHLRLTKDLKEIDRFDEKINEMTQKVEGSRSKEKHRMKLLKR
ncbi:AVN_HP_G0129660.mRNA.1.CDS.1 [Saccharomyces cerevisiae]|nr:AVN_HP_G0129660.mRNA.1.CDS.1 [Saccharomyces cerevisiae]CAI6397206.1 AVN_HP_G0129660.mRNA.1.CDS.1 [Saccharomyces cerevisiae]